MKIFIFILILYIAFFMGIRIIKQSRSHKVLPIVTIIVFRITAILGLIQIAFPQILDVLGRDPEKLISGEWWRIVTPLFVQDGGLSGLISNLFLLGILGVVVERLFNRKKWIVLYFGTGILAECIAYLWYLRGAGNSIANAGLASGLIMLAVFQTNTRTRIVGFACIGLALLLSLLGDLHGIALILGTFLASIILFLKKL